MTSVKHVRPRANAAFTLLLFAAGNAVAQPTAYVATDTGYSGQVAIVNLASGSVSGMIGTGRMPYGVAFHPRAPRVYVANIGEPTISVIDSAGGALVATIPVQSCPDGTATGGNTAGIALSPDGTRAYAGGAYFLAVIDTATNTLSACIPLPQGVSGVAVSPDGSRVYGAGYSLLLAIDPVAGTISTATIAPSYSVRPIAISPDGQRLYVPGNREVLVFRASDLTQINTVSVPPAPDGMALTKDGGRLYVINADPPRGLTEIDTQTLAIRTAPLIAASAGGYYRALDTPVGVAVNSSGDRIYVLSATPWYPGPDDDLFTVDALSLTGVGRVVVNNVRLTLGQFVSWNNPPVAQAGPDQVKECASAAGAQVFLDGSGSSDPDGDPLTFSWSGPFGTLAGRTINPTIPLGTHRITLTVTDNSGASATDDVFVSVRDTTPPVLALSLAPSVLWSADHRLVDVTAGISVRDACDSNPGVLLASVASSEPDDGQGDGDMSQDIVGATLQSDDRVFSLRAERSAIGPGRIYTVTYKATDASGNTATAAGRVLVPHDQGQP